MLIRPKLLSADNKSFSPVHLRRFLMRKGWSLSVEEGDIFRLTSPPDDAGETVNVLILSGYSDKQLVKRYISEALETVCAYYGMSMQKAIQLVWGIQRRSPNRLTSKGYNRNVAKPQVTKLRA